MGLCFRSSINGLGDTLSGPWSWASASSTPRLSRPSEDSRQRGIRGVLEWEGEKESEGDRGPEEGVEVAGRVKE